MYGQVLMFYTDQGRVTDSMYILMIFLWPHGYLCSCIEPLIPFMMAPPSSPNYLPKALPPQIITLEIKVSTYEILFFRGAWGEAKTFSPEHLLEMASFSFCSISF